MIRLPGSKEQSSKSKTTASAPKRPFLEIQYHPSDIRKGVRYLFLSRRRVAWITVGPGAAAALETTRAKS